MRPLVVKQSFSVQSGAKKKKIYVKAVTQQNGDEYNYTACGVLQVTLLIVLLIYSVVLQTVSLIQIQINVKKKKL